VHWPAVQTSGDLHILHAMVPDACGCTSHGQLYYFDELSQAMLGWHLPSPGHSLQPGR